MKIKQKRLKKALTLYTNKYKEPYVIEDKIDGLTGLIYKNKFYTRGDGNVGNNITHLLPLMNIPNSQEYGIRGEIVMDKEVFEEYKKTHPDASNPRNTASGLVNSKTIDTKWVSKLNFYAYQILNDTLLKPSQQIVKLREMGFKTPTAVVSQTISVENLETYLRQRKQQAPYDMDGLVIIQDENIEYPTDRNPYHSIAFKAETPVFETKVIKVEWNVSKDNRLKPIVYYEPVDYFGTILSKATGKNAKFIIENKIGKDAIIKITRGGDVIPDILEVVKPSTPQLPDIDPDDYKWDDTETDYILKYDTKDVYAKRLEFFIKTLEIENAGPARVKLMVDAGIDTINKLVNAQPKDFEKLERIGSKTAQKIYDSIQDKIKDVPLNKLMAASGVFGRGFGSRRINDLLKQYPNLLDIKENLKEKIMEVNGFGEIVTEQIINGLPRFRKFLDENPNIIFVIDKKVEPLVDVKQNLAGKVIVVTGFRGDERFKREVETRGGIYKDTAPSKKDAANTILVATGNAGGSKVETARKLKIPIMAKEEFEKIYFI
jgi:DNA ligase (NAD+)